FMEPSLHSACMYAFGNAAIFGIVGISVGIGREVRMGLVMRHFRGKQQDTPTLRFRRDPSGLVPLGEHGS
ncbi:hypothetical protein ACI3PL_25355, partial [Lacticaseibacillus paracasei]